MERNRKYAIRACVDCFKRSEIPFASHLLYPQILDELKSEEREQGITAGYEFWVLAEKIAVYQDYNISSGMQRAIERAQRRGLTVEYRRIGENP